MNKIEQMVKEMCPEGVPCVRLGDYYQRIKGTPITASKMKEIQKDNGEIAIFAGGKTLVYANESDIPSAKIWRNPAMLVQSRGVVDVQFCDMPFTFKNEMWAYTCDSKESVKYLYYYMKGIVPQLRAKASAMGSFPQISISDTEEIEIPLPPLPIQEAIVEILDKFESLQQGLQDELQARKKQYEYYRNKLLTQFPDNVQVKEYTLGELGTIKRGNGLQKRDFVESGVGCIHYGQIYTRLNSFTNTTLTFVTPAMASKLVKVEPGNLVIATTSENLEDVCKSVAWTGTEAIVTGAHACVYRHSQNPKYMAYFFQSENFHMQKRKYAYGAKVIDIKPESIAKITINLPSLEYQAQVASFLDHFETLVNDQEKGIPAEIAAVKKQYEYYRNKLLTIN